MKFPLSKLALYNAGRKRVREFCELNHISPPGITFVGTDNWFFDACAYYREKVTKGLDSQGHGDGINICVEKCQHPAGEEMSRNWSWPGYSVDRTPYGVLAHELGHHCDLLASEKRGSYYGDYSRNVVEEAAGEMSLTSYAGVNHGEWFAEAFRLFVTNPDLLRRMRPRTYGIICERWKPILPNQSWMINLGNNVPSRIVRAVRNKGVRG